MEALNSVINALLYSILIVAAFLGNFLVLLVVVRNRFMHTTTNFLLANLAVAGLWTAIWSIPFVVATLLPHHLRLHVQIYLHEQPKRGIHSCFSVYDGDSSSGKILRFTQTNGYTDEINERRCKKSSRWFVVV